MSAQLQDSVAYHFSDQCIAETNLLMGCAPETPEVLVYNGSAWRTVGLSDFVWPGENAAFYPLALSTEYIFFAVDEGRHVSLYHVSLRDTEYRMTFCGEFTAIAE